VNEALADPALQEWLAKLRKQQPDTAEPDLALVRAPRYRPAGPQLWSVRELRNDTQPVSSARLYRPSPGRLPLVLFAHGGGFVFGDLDSHDRVCRRLALQANAAVLSVDYRRAPEHPAPAAVDDLFNVARWAAGLPDELGPVMPTPALAGDSAGGAIAVPAEARLAKASMPLSAVLLICPNADLTLSQPSVSAKGNGWGLQVDALRRFVHQWAPNLSPEFLRRDSPLHADLRGLPTTLVATTEHDPLRDEGAALVDHLRDLDVDARHLPHTGLIHGFLTLDSLSPVAKDAGDVLMRRLGRLLPRVE
jgi:acetyl esterase